MPGRGGRIPDDGGNLGGLGLVLVVQAVIGYSYLALGVLAVITLLGLPVALCLPASDQKA